MSHRAIVGVFVVAILGLGGPAPGQQGPGSPAAAHWEFFVSSPGSSRKLLLASSFCPLICVIRPGDTPPVPRGRLGP